MTTIPIEEAQAKLSELIDHLQADDEVIITKNNQPVARLLPSVGPIETPRRPGTLRGTVTYMAPDFEAPLDEFQEYMP